MDADRRRLRRDQLERQLAIYRNSPPTPRGGWLKAVRESLGMSLEQFGRRLGITGPAAYNVEASEVRGSLSLSRLRRAADALGCDVVIVVVPRQPLDATLHELAMKAARNHVRRVRHTMALESQEVGDEVSEDIQRLAAEAMIETNDRRIWEA